MESEHLGISMTRGTRDVRPEVLESSIRRQMRGIDAQGALQQLPSSNHPRGRSHTMPATPGWCRCQSREIRQSQTRTNFEEQKVGGSCCGERDRARARVGGRATEL